MTRAFTPSIYDLLLLSTKADQLDPETFAALLEHARPSLRVIAGAECGFAHADDAVQAGAMTAMKRLSSFTPGTDFEAWVAAIVRGAARNLGRAERRHARRVRRAQAPDRTSQSDHAGLDGELLDALGALTSDQRVCLLLKATRGKTYAQIGAVLGIPEATARSHVFRARAAMLDRLGDRSTQEDAS